MACSSSLKQKRYVLDEAKLKQKLLGTKSAAETIERALGEIISEREGRARAWAADDGLIAMSAASRGFTVQTKNSGDDRQLAEFRSFNWEVV